MNDIFPFEFSKDSFNEQRNISFCYLEGKWEQISISDIERYKKINPHDWQLARLNSINHKYFVAIQTIARQEERYLKEWIEHHLNLGIDFIYIYDNNDEDGLDDFLKSALTEETYNKIEVIPWHEPMELQQFAALQDCVEKHKFDIKWLLTIDVDEFLILEMPLKDFLMEFEDASEIFLSWESFNANGQLYYEDKPVMERFTETFYCKDAGGQGKIFFRPTRLLHWGIHSASLTKGKTVNVLHKEIVAPQPFANIYQKAWINVISAGVAAGFAASDQINSYGYNPFDWDWTRFGLVSLDVFITLAAACIGIAVGVYTGNVIFGIGTFAGLNQLVNGIYYNFFASSNSALTNSSYNDQYLTRWERLDYTKTRLGADSVYVFWSRQFYGEYSLHMYGYFLFPNNNSLKTADVTPYSFDFDHGIIVSTGINFVAYFLGLFGF